MKKGLILLNAYYINDSIAHQARRMAEELEGLGAEIHTARNDGANVFLDGDGNIVNLYGDYSFAVFLDKDRHISRMLEKSGVRLFNSAESIEVCDDKILTHIKLAGEGIRMPVTVSAPLCYRYEGGDGEFRMRLVERLGFPMIVKEAYGSMGQQVYLIKDEVRLAEIIERLRYKPHLYQKYIRAARGCDTRVIVIGGRAVAAMRRTSETDFRSNLELGGRGEKTEIDGAVRDMCEHAARVLGLDYCGVDILDDGGTPVLCEVNSNAFFAGIETVTGENVAGCYARHIMNSIKETLNKHL